MAGIHNEILYGVNVDFTGGTVPTAQVVSDGQLLIGAASAPNIRVGDLVQPAAGIVYTYSQPTGTTARITTSLANDLAAVEGLSGTGLATRTASDTWTTRSLTQPAAGFTIANNDGVSGNPTFALSDDLAAVEALSGTGLATRTASNTWTTRSIAVTSNTGLSITNGDGVAGNPTLAGIDATDTVKGVVTLNFNDFLVTAGNVSLANRVRLSPGMVENLGIAYSSGTGTFTVQGADGTALASTNPGYVVIPSKANPGRMVKFTLTANQTFIDDNGASQIIGNLFGLTTSIAAAVDIPFYLYAVMDDTEASVAFMISRFPNASTSPVNTKIGKSGSAVASTQGSFFSLANITVTSYDQNPCVSIGSFRMRMSNLNDWTVQTLNNTDGIGKFQEGVQFAVPPGQFGNASGKYFQNNGGVAPGFTTSGFVYYMYMTNCIQYYQAFVNCNVAGTGVVTLGQSMPFNSADGGLQGPGALDQAGAITLYQVSTLALGNATVIFPFTNAAAGAYLNNNTIGAGTSLSANGTLTIQYS